MKRFSLTLALAVSCGSLWASELRAEDRATELVAGARLAKEPAKADKARELAKKSAEAYRRGDFKEAIALIDEAYAVDPQPVLLYNKARAHEGLGETDEAIANYERFLELEPTTRDRGAIEQRLTTLRRQRDERAAFAKARSEQQPAAAPPPAPAPASSPRKSSAWPYVLAGVGGAGIVTGAVFGLMALSRKDEAKDEPTQRKAMDLKDEAETLATISTVSFIVGGALIGVGAMWRLLDMDEVFGRSKAQRGSLRVALGPGYVGASMVLP